VTKTAWLRVYQPLEAFPASERSGLTSREDSEIPGPESWLVRAVLPDGGAWVGWGDGAYVREVGDKILVCPRRTRLRSLAGMLAFRDALPQEVADAFVPEPQAHRAARELAAMGEQHPHARSHILHANWHVPLRWFVGFEAADRTLTEDKQGLKVRYEAPLSAAKARLARAMDILESSGLEGWAGEALAELGGWLDDFVGEGLLELDYGSVAELIAPDELADENSAADVWACLQSFSEGDEIRAQGLFQDLAARWAAIRAREIVN
jgi:hypothetical protein